MNNDTIAAIATAPGEAGIGIVRISGNNAIDIADKLFKGKRVEKLSEAEQRKLTYGYIIDPKTGDKVDEVLAVYMKAPYTYTTEDVVEINCHGGSIPVRKVLELVLENGARMAERGEFTKRAFLNGRIDLSQAEAVMDLISAKTDTSYDVSLNQLEGKLSKEVREIRNILLNMLAHIEVSIDFPEEDIEQVTYEEIKKQGHEVYDRIKKLLDTVNTGKILREGLKTVILGKPNVGKSSLLNSLLRENRAIVTDVPGTTRDIIEEYINIKGIPLKLVDTAGIRQTEDIVEKIGVERAKELLNTADLVIAVFDASRELTEEDFHVMETIKDKKAIVLLNKTDLPVKTDENVIREKLGDKEIIKSSMVKEKGIDQLEETLRDMFFEGEVKISDNIIVTNVRHRDSLLKARNNIHEALEAIELGMTLDCIEVDVKDCWSNLGEITGDTVSEDIIDKIFKDFCIGK
ncbi:tRNA uridine-5-carboxymethylaminomethyl(34) synthesis GTPase MnmE [Caldisalinibacter kiritimatiensis]|uniref:tRNA modification GTPase MnmE n=1 Tax=Caldisalinibacter kiritimatiensis TaxID=1304284 RepID=R1AQM7_9FIRM|nr:tRNA uridine-5-carboxymethylaminomethyl(34) synthesis GTPase MnmE [Caldisalinibacter kiritimatiensis]EOC99427.1 GTPase and tRNA-U34 5-formylation enzyme TrmE [Caldisalinibacter kiritimatiensis]